MYICAIIAIKVREKMSNILQRQTKNCVKSRISIYGTIDAACQWAQPWKCISLENVNRFVPVDKSLIWFILLAATNSHQCAVKQANIFIMHRCYTKCGISHHPWTASHWLNVHYDFVSKMSEHKANERKGCFLVLRLYVLYVRDNKNGHGGCLSKVLISTVAITPLYCSSHINIICMWSTNLISSCTNQTKKVWVNWRMSTHMELDPVRFNAMKKCCLLRKRDSKE